MSSFLLSENNDDDYELVMYVSFNGKSYSDDEGVIMKGPVQCNKPMQ